jgi:hypothetical protein
MMILYICIAKMVVSLRFFVVQPNTSLSVGPFFIEFYFLEKNLVYKRVTSYIPYFVSWEG